MPRPKNAVPTVSKTFRMPKDLAEKVELLLFSELEGKVPFAEWQAYLCGLVRADLDRRRRISEALSKSEKGAENG